MVSQKIATRGSRLLHTTSRCVAPSQRALSYSSRAYLSIRHNTSARTPATQSRWATLRPLALGTPAKSPRTYSTESPSDADANRHEISDRGTKIWNFEQDGFVEACADQRRAHRPLQINELTKNPGKVVLVDTREPSELEHTGYIPGAVNIPVGTRPESFWLPEEDFEDSYGFARPPKDAEVVFYCKAGVRSRAAAVLAKEAGWTNVGEYPGSWVDWEDNGGKVQK
ncbi:hypothetical protein ACRALDRAFT_2028958 [Sodiomyces alcalophilus JCM 7366]|uniref:uncharacterized protein n=1 Tax=Sodiomyces alcalophilus JCM 7366 TaxID=591952 RepID=UPI0039B69671